MSLAVASEELFASLQKADPGPTLEEDNDDDADEPPPLLDEDDDPQAASRTPITTRKEPRRHTHRSVISSPYASVRAEPGYTTRLRNATTPRKQHPLPNSSDPPSLSGASLP
ncbi:MAG: hypothetical protein E6J14_06430 [Chloroflexi bacterium]|nr:MAG: hypothetical protein E6J14_06430 [Chloroflexota bacterium]